MDEIKQIDAVRYPFIQAYTHFVKKPERAIVGREKEIRLILSAFCRPELSNVLLLADPGAGKAHPNDTPIATPTGFVPIGSLHAGDVVYDEMGKEVLVSGVFPQGLKRVYRVFFSDGSFIDCNDEHIWAVRNRKGHKENGSYSNLTLREMLDKGIVTKKKKPKWFIPLNGALSRENRALSMDPYVFGALISGGYFSFTDGVLHFQSKSLSVVEKVCRTFLPGGSFRRMGEDGWIFVPDAKCTDSYFTVSDMEAGVYPTTFLLYKGSFPTFIPTMYLEGSCFQRISLLQGIVDVLGDWNERGELSFSVTEKIFAQNIKELANSLGIRVMITPKYHDKEYRISYELRFLLSTKKARALFLASPLRDTEMETERTKEVTDLSITGVSDLGYEEEMTCIMVDSKTHLYQIGHEHIVTHNTALVQAVSVLDHSRVYLEVDLARMLTELANQNEMAARLKTLFDEAAAFGQNEGKELVLFIDEFHQIVQLSPAGVEALKPLLADSGTRGIRVVVATTYEEFDQYVSSNQALVERLMRINIRQPDKKMTVEILRGMARRYGVSDEFPNDNMFELIYEYTQRYMPSNSQPRKSILMLDAMVGWYKSERRRMDRKLLADVLYDTQGVDVAFKVDATKIKDALDKRVFSQDYATSAVAKRLQLCVADLNDKTKPQSSFLMTGSSGVGKTELSKTLAKLLFSDDRALTRMDMTEYALPDSLERFREELTRRVWARPNCIVLLDEVEKACAPVTRILLQVLDDGRLSDRNGREVSFLNAYIIMTTNAGSEIYRNIASYSSDDTGSGEHLREYDALIRRSITETTGGNRFPPELLGRVDVIVPFQPLSENTIYKIVRTKLDELCREVAKKHNVTLRYTKRVLDFVVKDNLTQDSDAGGARRAISTLEAEITTKVAKFINENPSISRIGVDIEGVMINEDKNIRKSRAYAVVKGIRG